MAKCHSSILLFTSSLTALPFNILLSDLMECLSYTTISLTSMHRHLHQAVARYQNSVTYSNFIRPKLILHLVTFNDAYYWMLLKPKSIILFSFLFLLKHLLSKFQHTQGFLLQILFNSSTKFLAGHYS